MIEKPRPDLLPLSKTFYDLSVSCNLFSKPEIRQIGDSGNRGVKAHKTFSSSFLISGRKSERKLIEMYHNILIVGEIFFAHFMETYPRFNHGSSDVQLFSACRIFPVIFLGTNHLETIWRLETKQLGDTFWALGDTHWVSQSKSELAQTRKLMLTQIQFS